MSLTSCAWTNPYASCQPQGLMIRRSAAIYVFSFPRFPQQVSSLFDNDREQLICQEEGCLYSLYCREGEFSETHLPDLATLCVRTGGKPISSLCPGPMGQASCYAFGWIFSLLRLL